MIKATSVFNFTANLKKMLKTSSLPNILCMFSWVASVSVALVGIFPVTVSVFVAEKRVTARRTGTLAVCWVLFVSVAVATVRLRWKRHGGGGGCYVIHGRWGRPCRAKVWQPRPKEPKRKHLVDLQRLSCSGPYPQCTSMSRVDALIPLNLYITKNIYFWHCGKLIPDLGNSRGNNSITETI